MFDFIKKLFSSNEVVSEKISAEELEQWFEEKAEVLQKESKETLDLLRKELLGKINSTRSALEGLEKAELRNSKISVRELQFMDGNRKAYIQKSEHFLKEIEDILEYELHFFLPNYKEHVDNFAKITARPYMILQEFLATESREIALGIKEIDNVVEKLKKDEKIQKHAKIEKIRRELDSIGTKKEKIGELISNVEKLKKGVSDLIQKEKELSDRKKLLLDSNEYKDLVNLEEEKVRIELDLKGLKDKLYSDFSLLGRPLKKYQRIAYNYDKLIEHYHTDALNALVTDSGLKIVEILAGLSKNIKEGSVELKDKKSGKVLNIIRKMDKKYFEDFLKKYNEALKKKEEIENEISENKVNEEIEGVKAKLHSVKDNHEASKTQIKKHELELSSINLDQLRQKVKDEIENVLEIKVEME